MHVCEWEWEEKRGTMSERISSCRAQWKKVKVSVTQLCPTLCDSMDFSPPGSSVHEILQTTTLKWVTVPFSRVSSWHRIEPRSPAQQADFFYHLSHQGSPAVPSRTIKKQTSIPSLSNNHPQHFIRERIRFPLKSQYSIVFQCFKAINKQPHLLNTILLKNYPSSSQMPIYASWSK